MLSRCRSRLTPRRAQQEVLDLIFGPKRDEPKWYISSPPGSGKTILGLWTAVRLNVRTLVLVPNTAIREQWVAKSRFFLPDDPDAAPIASTDPDALAPITVLTYQALARTAPLTEDERARILAAWHAELLDEGQEPDEAREWLDAYERENADRFEAGILSRRNRGRNETEGDDLLGVVEGDALALMHRFRDAGVGLVIFDECHHLVGYWAQVALALLRVLGEPRVLGLTATPPSARDLSDREILLHREVLQDLDYALPTPAVVRDGDLAPYQDLVIFTRPTDDELEFVRNCSNRLREVLASVEAHPGTTLSGWLLEELGSIPETAFPGVLRRRAAFLGAAVRYLQGLGREVPTRFAPLAGDGVGLEEQAELVGRYASRCLLVSPLVGDRELFDNLARAFRPLGYRLTDRGLQRQQSAVNRVLALSQAKMTALVDILTAERKYAGDRVRGLVICDFEKSSATVAKDASRLLTSESGGAVAAMRALTSNPETDCLDPILVTGQTVLVDDDLFPVFEREGSAWFRERGLSVDITAVPDEGFCRVSGKGSDWSTRTYVAMITDLFERGITRCLVGTRGLLGEGWDSLAANTLVDLTTAATRMTVNQLRGRTIRLDPANPGKVANIWDVVCFAPEFEQGLTDYARFARKHAEYFGLCDDGAIEYGLGHIHPALTEAGPEDVALHAHLFNAEMLERARNRDKIRADWRVGTPYENTTLPALEIKGGGLFGNRAVRGPLEDMQGIEIAASEVLGNLSRAILDGLAGLRLLEDPGAGLRVTERAGGYFRVFLETGSRADNRLFSRCLGELFMPIDGGRYIIPRYEQVLEHTWLSKLLPEILGRYVKRARIRIAVYHPLPGVFAKSRREAELFSDEWNEHVSPGRAVFAQRGPGEAISVRERQRSRDILAARAKLKSVWR